MRLSEVRHQERAISILRRALGSGRTHHAYLFDGPAGVGKELAARALAARLVCADQDLAPDADACGECPACQLMAAGNHPDYHLIDRRLHKLHPDSAIRQGKGLFLVVDLIRHFLIEPATMKPTMGRRRVFVIRDAERMNEGAQNALLKTLEEPPGAAVLILVTASASRLLPTIRSRCQRVPFGLLPQDFVRGQLIARLGMAGDQAHTLARLSAGQLGVALHWHSIDLLAALDAVGDCLDDLPAGDPEAFGKALVEIAAELATRSMQIAAEHEAESAFEGENSAGWQKAPAKTVPTDDLRDALKLVLLLVASFYRDALMAAAGAASMRGLAEQQSRTERLAASSSLDHLDMCLTAINEAERTLDRNVAPQLTCERMAVALMGELPLVG